MLKRKCILELDSCHSNESQCLSKPKNESPCWGWPSIFLWFEDMTDFMLYLFINTHIDQLPIIILITGIAILLVDFFLFLGRILFFLFFFLLSTVVEVPFKKVKALLSPFSFILKLMENSYFCTIFDIFLYFSAMSNVNKAMALSIFTDQIVWKLLIP